jgi:hypothetical protein
MYARNDGQSAEDAQGERDHMRPRALEAARYICHRLPGLPKTTFVKLLYLVDREYARRSGMTLSGVSWWREQHGPLNGRITEMLDRPEFTQEVSTTPFGNRRIGITVDAVAFDGLGSAELSVLDLVLARYGSLRQADLLDLVHALPEVERAPMKAHIDLAFPVPARGSTEYLERLLEEIRQEDAAGISPAVMEIPADEYAARQQEAEALARFITD